MKINPKQETAASLLTSAISRDKFKADFDFQSSLNTARENLNRPRKQPSTAPEAMQEAVSTAHQELEEYLRKGPIAYMRERILEEMGLTEEDVEKMPPDERDALEKTIAARMKEMLLAGTGVTTADIQAQLLALGMRHPGDKR